MGIAFFAHSTFAALVLQRSLRCREDEWFAVYAVQWHTTILAVLLRAVFQSVLILWSVQSTSCVRKTRHTTPMSTWTGVLFAPLEAHWSAVRVVLRHSILSALAMRESQKGISFAKIVQKANSFFMEILFGSSLECTGNKDDKKIYKNDLFVSSNNIKWYNLKLVGEFSTKKQRHESWNTLV